MPEQSLEFLGREFANLSRVPQTTNVPLIVHPSGRALCTDEPEHPHELPDAH